MQVRSLGREDPLEKEMAAHSSILAWKIPRTAEVRGVEKSRTQLSEGKKHHTRHFHYMLPSQSCLK